jgi:L-lactate dehydrogenase complex protein LldG
MALANSARARILRRIRCGPQVPFDAAPVSLEQIYGSIGDPMARFLEECAANLTEVKRTRDWAASLFALRASLQAVPDGQIYVEDAPPLRAFAEAFHNREVLYSSAGRAPENCQATVTLCDGLVAQSGSIVSSSRHGGRCGSIVAPVHLVYATTDQLVPDISTALRNAMSAGLIQASYFGLISGSSRTADIEKILVQGAHGPRKVVLILEDR